MDGIELFQRNLSLQALQIRKMIREDAPKYFKGAMEKMKDANFSAQGFINNGSAERWKPRKKETHLTKGNRILHGTGILQQSVKVLIKGNDIVAGVDLDKVPYAKAHNEGGRIIQYVKPHHRKHYKTGKRYQVKAFTRKITMPKRQYLGYSPDIIKIASKEIKHAIDKIFNS